MKKIADINLREAQQQQKQWYDKNASFQPNDMVLLLLPTSTSKLLAQWQGPYRVLKKKGRTNYLTEMPHRRRKKWVFHINLLKKWEVPSSGSYSVEEVEEEFPDWKPTKSVEPTKGSQLTTQEKEDLGKMFMEFEDVLQSKPGQTDVTEHNIHTTSDRPIKVLPYRIPHAYREEVAKESEEMERRGIIEPSHSEWSAPIVVVRKKDNKIRLCVDYRRLNATTPMDAYPMPRMDELIDKLGKAKYITTLDLASGYWQVPMSKEDRPKTAFSTPKGLYQFKVMPFGLNGAQATFQRMMDGIIRGIEEFTAVYLDDIIIFSETWEQHRVHIREVMQRLRKSKLTAKPSKCQFGMTECTYLGHVVGNGKVKVDQLKVHAVENFPQPQNIRSFLGLTGYYRRFIKDYARIATPLSDLTKKSLPDKIQWNDDCERAFVTLKRALCQSPVLINPNFDKPFVLQTDASDRGIGAVLSQQDDDGNDLPVAYFSRKLLPREVRYSTVEKECLAIKLGIETFKVYLLGRQFTIQTDHRALMWLNKLKEKNARLTRWSLALQPYTFEIVHRAGTANGNADGLSRAAFDTTDN